MGNSFPNSSPTSPSENPPTSAHTATPVVADWQVGEVVTVETDIPSLKDLDGHQGTIEAVREVSAQCLVKFVSDQQQVLYVPWSSLRRIQVAVTPCPPSSKIGSRIQCGEFIGTLAARNGNGWFVNWETSALLRKKIGEPPAVVKDGEFKLIN